MPEVVLRTWMGEFVLRSPWTGGHRPPDVDPEAVIGEAAGDRFVAGQLRALAERVRGPGAAGDVARVLTAAVQDGSLELVCCPTWRPLAAVAPRDAVDLTSLADAEPVELMTSSVDEVEPRDEEPTYTLHLCLDIDDGVGGHVCLRGGGQVLEVPVAHARHGEARFEDVQFGCAYTLVHVADDGTETLVADAETLDRLLDAIESGDPGDDFEPLDVRPLRRDDDDDDLADPAEVQS